VRDIIRNIYNNCGNFTAKNSEQVEGKYEGEKKKEKKI
jgi:hypothetical protein